MKQFKVTASDITHYEAKMLAADENQAWALAKEMDGSFFRQIGESNWAIIDLVEIPVRLTAEQQAFIDAYGLGVSDYPAEAVQAWFLIDDGDEFNDKYGSGAYTSIADAHNMWHAALSYARESK